MPLESARVTGPTLWEERIRHALKHGGFMLYAQPILNLRTGKTAQYELLLRLTDAPGRVVSPKEFVGVAEQTGLIRLIDHWVVREAVRLLAAQVRQGRELALEVNVSGLALTDDELLGWIRQELAATRVPASRLVLEITETTAIADMHRACQFVETLKAMGCRFALDDFGVGCGSFAYLKHLPLDYVKIDGSFIRHLSQDPVDSHIVKAIVAVARAIGIQIIAECVEDAQTLEVLRQYGVDFAQGYYVGRPRPVAEVDFGVAGGSPQREASAWSP